MSPRKSGPRTHKIPRRDILVLLAEAGPIRMSELAKRLGVTRQAMFYRLEQMERRGIVSRTRGDKTIREADLWRLRGVTSQSNHPEA